MKIGEAAQMTGLTASNIRFYEKKGLLCPKRREDSKYREYTLEDVRRLKEIMLLRKMGVPVESIFLLYEGQVKLSNLIERQEEELSERIETLAGARRLCRLLREERTVEGLDVDRWLHYVSEEEGRGQKFAAAEELSEDLAIYMKFASFRADPYVGRFFQKQWVARILSVLSVLALVAAAVSSVAAGGGIAGRGAVFFWLVFLGTFCLDFYWFYKKRR